MPEAAEGLFFGTKRNRGRDAVRAGDGGIPAVGAYRPYVGAPTLKHPSRIDLTEDGSLNTCFVQGCKDKVSFGMTKDPRGYSYKRGNRFCPKHRRRQSSNPLAYDRETLPEGFRLIPAPSSIKERCELDSVYAALLAP